MILPVRVAEVYVEVVELIGKGKFVTTVMYALLLVCWIGSDLHSILYLRTYCVHFLRRKKPYLLLICSRL